MLVGGSGARADPVFRPAYKLAGAAGGTEPRVAVGPAGRRWVVTNDAKSGDAIVFASADDGATWTRTPAEPTGQVHATIDTDVVGTRTGRIVATELDGAGINLVTSYSDDGGKSWTPSLGTRYADEDRPWLAVGPDDPTTRQPRVYLLFHDLFAGSAQHNMFVATSTDGGASFGPPVPLTLPPSQAYQDLTCADSSGPSGIAVNQTTGQVYAVWATRSAPLGGGCGASAFGTFEISTIMPTRIWVATAPAGGTQTPGAWRSSLAVDDSAANRIVGMQFSPAAVDSEGNVYVAYAESPNAAPDYDGAAIRYVWARPNNASWSPPVTVAPAGGPGHLIPQIAAGLAGELDLAYYTGRAQPGPSPAWYVTAAQVHGGLTAQPQITSQTLSSIPAYTGAAGILSGDCATGPAAGAESGFVCKRATDDWGVALDASCRVTFAWPAVANQAQGSDAGTFLSTQTGGTTVCQSPGAASGPASSGRPGAAGQGPPCARSPTLTFRVHGHARRGRRSARVVGVAVFVNGVRVRRISGANLTKVTISHPPLSHFTVRIVTTLSTGGRVTSRRSYRSCGGRTKVRHRATHAHSGGRAR